MQRRCIVTRYPRWDERTSGRSSKVRCEHCKGTTTCHEACCGHDTGKEYGDGKPILIPGKCTTCDGKGFVYD